jgi:hypothetical protein
MATFADNLNTQALDQRPRADRRRIAAMAAALVIAGGIGAGTYAIIGHTATAPKPAAAVQAKAPAPQAAATQPAAAAITPAGQQAANVTPAKPNPDIPSGNNIGNMGTGGGPTVVPNGPSMNNTGNMGTGVGPAQATGGAPIN